MPLIPRCTAFIAFVAITATAISACGKPSTTPSTPSKKFFVDCRASTRGSGTRTSPWNSLVQVNSHGPFKPGNTILLKAGTICQGRLGPHGSGTRAAPISLSAYGSGHLPIVDDGHHSKAALSLFDQQYWHVSNLEIEGGRSAGVYIGANRQGGTHLSDIRLSNLFVHDGSGGSKVGTDPSGNALICVCGGYSAPGSGYNPQFRDVLVDHVTVDDARSADGIYVAAAGLRIQNSLVTNTGRSGIWAGDSRNVAIRNNDVDNAGIDPQSSGVIGIWVWNCRSCMIQHNTVSNVTSGDRTDGGAFDIDYYSHNVTVQDNYAHDVDGYCVSVFGAGDTVATGAPTTNSIIRFNVCSHTGIGPDRHAGFSPEGSILLETWNGGSLNGVQIYNNTIYARPAKPVSGLQEISAGESVRYTGNHPDLFENNLVYSTVRPMISIGRRSAMRLGHNLYFDPHGPDGADSTWHYRGRTYTGFSAWKARGADPESLYTDPHLPNPTYHGALKPTSALTPPSGSPAVDTGTNICAHLSGSCSMGRHDFLGRHLGSNISIGAIQGRQ